MGFTRRQAVAMAGAVLTLPRSALAQLGRFTIRMVVGFPPGGSGDVIARLTANGLSEELKQTVITDNRPGAGGLTAAEYVTRAGTDGSTLILHTGSSAITAPICKKTPPYDAVVDFSWIAHLCTAPFVIAVNPKLPAADLKSFIAYAKTQDPKLSYSSAGVGTTVHLAAEVFMDMVGMKAIHIPYRGSGPAIIDTMAGNVAFNIETIGTLLPYHKAGTLRILAVFADQRIALAPDIPTAKESGIDLSTGTPSLLAGPPKMDPKIVETLSVATHDAMNGKELLDQLASQGIQAVTNSNPQAAKDYVAAEIARLKPFVQKLGIAT